MLQNLSKQLLRGVAEMVRGVDFQQVAPFCLVEPGTRPCWGDWGGAGAPLVPRLLTPLWPIEHACLGAARTGRLVLPVWARRASGCLSHVLCVAVDGQWCRMVLGGIARAGPSWLAGLLGLGGEGRGAGDDLQEIADPAVP